MISQTLDWADSALFWIALVLVFTGLLKSNRRVAKLSSNGNVHFSPRWWFVCAWVFILVRFGYIGAHLLRTDLKEPIQSITGCLMLIAAIAGLLSLPGPLVVTNEALEEINWVWPNKKIRWTEIEEINTEKRGSAVTVIGSSRRKIMYTNVYPDRPRFLFEIKKHCGDELPTNFLVKK